MHLLCGDTSLIVSKKVLELLTKESKGMVRNSHAPLMKCPYLSKSVAIKESE